MGNNSSASVPRPIRVVVIGGGAGGSLAARQLEKIAGVTVTLVDTKDFFEVTPASVSVALGKDLDDIGERLRQVTIRHSDYLKSARVVVSAAVSIGADFKSVQLANGETLEAEYLVMATGSTYAAPWKAGVQIHTVQERLADFKDSFGKIHDAREILIIGGGPVGVEVAAEIIEAHPEKTVHLVHAHERLLERQHATLSKKAKKFFEKSPNCKLHLGEKAVKIDGKERVTYELSVSKTVIRPDAVFACYDSAPITGFMRPNHADHLDERGFIKVNEYLQLHGAPNVYAIGDCNDLKIEKMAKNAAFQAEYVAQTIVAAASGKPLKKLGKEPPGMIISLGTKGGLMDAGMKLTGFTSAGSAVAASVKKMVPGMVLGNLTKK